MNETLAQRIVAAMLMVLVLGLVGLTLYLDKPRQIPAQCDTDTDCIRLCDPKDKECDGGPQ